MCGVVVLLSGSSCRKGEEKDKSGLPRGDDAWDFPKRWTTAGLGSCAAQRTGGEMKRAATNAAALERGDEERRILSETSEIDREGVS